MITEHGFDGVLPASIQDPTSEIAEVENAHDESQRLLAGSSDLLLYLEKQEKTAEITTTEGNKVEIKAYYMNNADEGLDLGVWKVDTPTITARLHMLPISTTTDGRNMRFQASVSHIGADEPKPVPAGDDEMLDIARMLDTARSGWEAGLFVEDTDPKPLHDRLTVGKAISNLFHRNRQ